MSIIRILFFESKTSSIVVVAENWNLFPDPLVSWDHHRSKFLAKWSTFPKNFRNIFWPTKNFLATNFFRCWKSLCKLSLTSSTTCHRNLKKFLTKMLAQYCHNFSAIHSLKRHSIRKYSFSHALQLLLKKFVAGSSVEEVTKAPPSWLNRNIKYSINPITLQPYTKFTLLFQLFCYLEHAEHYFLLSILFKTSATRRNFHFENWPIFQIYFCSSMKLWNFLIILP